MSAPIAPDPQFGFGIDVEEGDQRLRTYLKLASDAPINWRAAATAIARRLQRHIVPRGPGRPNRTTAAHDRQAADELVWLFRRTDRSKEDWTEGDWEWCARALEIELTALQDAGHWVRPGRPTVRPKGTRTRSRRRPTDAKSDLAYLRRFEAAEKALRLIRGRKVSTLEVLRALFRSWHYAPEEADRQARLEQYVLIRVRDRVRQRRRGKF